jgi:NitT/TauT family transport system substrate-binding protein
MNEVNKLIWPVSLGAGTIDAGAWDRTVSLAMDTKNLEGSTVLTAAPTEGAYTNDIVTAALAILDELGVDYIGNSFAPLTVTLNEGGN